VRRSKVEVWLVTGRGQREARPRVRASMQQWTPHTVSLQQLWMSQGGPEAFSVTQERCSCSSCRAGSSRQQSCGRLMPEIPCVLPQQRVVAEHVFRPFLPRV